MLREIRVTDKEERIERIYKYFAEINDSPIVYDWKYHMCEIDPEEAIGLANLNRYTSTLLTLKLWIKPFELISGIRGCKLPVYGLLHIVPCFFPFIELYT